MKYIYIIGLTIILIIAIFKIIEIENQEENRQNANELQIEYQSRQEGQSIGRNAMIQYVIETNQVCDGQKFNLEITRLLDIEDSLYNVYKINKE